MASEKVLYKAKDGTLINLSTKVINNTTSDSTTDALSAAQGKILASKFTTLTKSSVGLDNVDNTADADKSVNYATSAGSASSATTASKLGSSTVGSTSKPIYLNNGAAAVCTGIMKAPKYSTTDLTPGVSDLENGQIYIVYYD